MSQFNLAICIPSGPQVSMDFTLCLVNLLLAFRQTRVPGYTSWACKILNKRTSILPKSRQELLQDAMDLGCTHALFLDTDQTFPSTLPAMLARHGKRVIGCNVATKSKPAWPTARNKNPQWAGGDVVYSNNKDGLEAVWRLGTGVMLLHLETISKLPKPWFSAVWNAEMNDFTGEDWFFCEQLEAAGIPIWVDHGASRMIGHIGSYTYEHVDVEQPASN